MNSVVSAYVADPSFVPHKPQVLVTPDRLPILRWKPLSVELQVSPAELRQFKLCTLAVCPQAALDAGAAYYVVTANGIVEHARLVGTSDQARSAGSTDPSVSPQALASATTDTEAGVPAPGPS